MPKIGRPSKLTPALISKIADCFFDGLTDHETSLLCDLDTRTIERIRAGGFCREVKKAEAARLQIYIRKIRDGRGNDWIRIAWFLERRFPDRFAKPEIQLSFNNSYTQNNLTVQIAGSEAKTIEAEAKPIRSKVEELFKQYRPSASDHNGS